MIETEIFRLADVGLKMTDKNMETKSFSHQFYRTTLEAWDAMYQAVLGAKKSIYWEIYIFLDDQAGARFVDALCNKAQAGVEVKIVVDAIGSWGLSRAAAKRLAEAGPRCGGITGSTRSWRWANGGGGSGGAITANC